MAKKRVKVAEKDYGVPEYLFHQGNNFKSYEFFGAHIGEKDGKKGVFFRTWAPRAKSVSVVGDFNGWDKKIAPMNRITDGGIYEVFVEGVKNYDVYKYAVTSRGKTVNKADPFAFYAEKPQNTASIVYDIDGFCWEDADYFNKKDAPYDKPMNIYEVNLASWKRHENGDYYTYKEYADELVDYIVSSNYTHVELMPITEYPFDGSWGYQVTGYFAPTSRFGEPREFMYFINACHKKGIGVIIDWVPAHFPKDEHGLYEFDGYPCYEYSQPTLKEHKGWGTRIFDWGKTEVQSFLISSANFFFEKYHVDGLRVDAVSSMLYLDYDRKQGEWVPNVNGGNYNLEAIAFFQKLNSYIFGQYKNALMIAEESTSFPMVTGPVDKGGLGFNYKWNMGWMNDVLSYVEYDPYFKSTCHDKLTFSLCYAFSENYILPISHDEVVHGKKSLLDKMPGDVYTKFCNLRTFLMYMYAHPGKKLSFMGNEFAQFKEWDYKEGLEFFMRKFELHDKLYKFQTELNSIYKNNPALYEIENSWDGFSWISADERDNNVIAFERRDKKGNKIIAVMNFSGNDYYKYRIGVDKGEYKVLLCTDDKKFGGSGTFKGRTFKSVRKTAHGKANSICITLPKFTGVYFVLSKKL